MAAGQGDHFLHAALEDERCEEVEEVDLGEDVDFESFVEAFFKCKVVLASASVLAPCL